MSIIPKKIFSDNSINVADFATVSNQIAAIVKPSQSLGIQHQVDKLKKLEDAILEPKKYYANRRKRIEEIGEDLNINYKNDFEKALFARDVNGDVELDVDGNAKTVRSIESAKAIAEAMTKSKYEVAMILLNEEYPADFSDLATNKLIKQSKLKLNNPDLEIKQK